MSLCGDDCLERGTGRVCKIMAGDISVGLGTDMFTVVKNSLTCQVVFLRPSILLFVNNSLLKLVGMLISG